MIPTVPSTPNVARGGFSAGAGSVWSTLPGLVARYRNATTSSWPDTVGGFGDGTHTGSPSTATNGVATGMAYNGTTQYTTAGTTASLRPLIDSRLGTMMGWIVWPGSTNKLSGVIGCTVTGTDRGVSLYVEDRAVASATAQLRCIFANGSTATSIVTPNNTVPAATLTHVAIVLDGTNGTLYVNGAVVGSPTALVAAGTPANTTRAPEIGAIPFTSRFFGVFSGVFDVAVSTADLSSYLPSIVAEGPG